VSTIPPGRGSASRFMPQVSLAKANTLGVSPAKAGSQSCFRLEVSIGIDWKSVYLQAGNQSCSGWESVLFRLGVILALGG
jgi:hypothetical protein